MVSFAKIVTRIDVLNNWIRALSLLLVLAYVLSLGAAFYWFFDLFRHFIGQYAILAVLLGAAAALRKLRGTAFLMLALLVFCGAEIYSHLDYAPATVSKALHKSALLKVIVYNRHHSLTAHADMVAFIKAEEPDIFFILEANSTHAEALEDDLGTLYPHRILEPNDRSAFGMVAAGKTPFTAQARLESPPDDQTRVIRNFLLSATIAMTGAQEVTFYAMHPPPPTNAFLFAQRNAELSYVSKLISERHAKQDNVVLLGDWNVTPYSPFFSRLLADTGLKNQVTTLYFLPSWPSILPPLLQIPIDHVLFKGGMELIEKRRGPSMGSDHHAIVATFLIER